MINKYIIYEIWGSGGIRRPRRRPRRTGKNKNNDKNA